MHARHGSRFVLALLLGLLACTARATTVEITVEEIPTPRTTGWAVDLTGTLPAERLAELNQLGDQIKEKTGAEMAVVVVSSTNGVDAHDFATRLFNAWGIGERGKENGLLVFAALADHKAEIVLGRGLDGEAGRRESEAVMQGEMVPRFRAGNPAGAVVLGALACARRILGVSPIHSALDGLEMVPETVPEATSYAPNQTMAPELPVVPQPEPDPNLSAQAPNQVRFYPAKLMRDVVGFLVFFLLALLIVGRIAFLRYTQGEGMVTRTLWANSSYDDREDRYDRSMERLEEERTTTSSSAASLGSFSSGTRSASSPSSSNSSSGSSSGSSSSSGFSGGSSSGGGASGSW